MPLFNVPVRLHATLYVKAESPEEALKLAADYCKRETVWLEVNDGAGEYAAVSDAPLDAEDLPAISFSPVATPDENMNDISGVEEIA